MLYRLGKKPAKHDLRTLNLKMYLTEALPPPPPSVDYSQRAAWHLFANDRLGDCTCASAGNVVGLWTALEGTEAAISDQQVIDLYNRVNGGRDQGALCLEVLNTWRAVGLADEAPIAYASIEPGNSDHIKTAVDLFAGVYIGLVLPASAQSQVGSTWEFVADSSRNQPGSWGGHCVNIVGYDDQGLTCVTWGTVQKMTWNFWQTYCDEAYALFTRDWNTVPSPTGVDGQQLMSDLAALGTMEP